MNEQRHYWIQIMDSNDTDFFQNLGRRITTFRKQANLTQVQLAQMLHVKQQVIASYEIGRRRVPVSFLPALSSALGVTVEELLGVQNGSTKPGPTPKIQRQIEQLRKLPKPKQRFVSELLETVLQTN